MTIEIEMMEVEMMWTLIVKAFHYGHEDRLNEGFVDRFTNG